MERNKVLALEGFAYAAMIPLLTLFSFLFLSFPFTVQAAGSVVINEIQVGGTEKATDEFIELYNPGSEDADLTGWRLSKKTASGSLSNLLTEFPSVAIPAHGFLLIAHNDYTGSAVKDLAYSTQSSITADNTVLLYSDNGKTIVDLVGMGNAGEGEGGNTVTPEPGQSIERKQTGSDSDNNAADFALRTVPTPKQETSDQGVANPVGEPAAPGSEQGMTGSGQGTTNATSTGAINRAPTNQTLITISELLPNPAGPDEEGEWIELTNLGNTELDLSDWSLEDASGKHFTIKQGGSIASTTIAPGGYYILSRTLTGISLNNTDSETVKLLSPNESTISAVTYAGTAKDDYSWARDAQGNYAWTTTPTAGASNMITQPEIVTKSPPNDSISTGAGNNVPPPPPAIPSVLPSVPPSLVINELLPNPAGDDVQNEWIELCNTSEDEVTTAGVTLKDASGQTYTLADDTQRVAAKSFLLIPRPMSSIALNNGGDTVILHFHETELDRISYGASKEGIAFAREGDAFSWTESPTPGRPNSLTMSVLEPEVEESDDVLESDVPSEAPGAKQALGESAKLKTTTKGKSTSKKTATTANGAYQAADIASLQDMSKGTKVTVTGTVTVPPKLFGKTQMYLNGIQIYSVSYPYPELTTGDVVVVSGNLSASGGETRITVPKQGLVKLVEHGEAPVPLALTADAFGDEHEGMLVTVEGEVVEKKGDTIWLDDGTGEIRIVLKEGTGIIPEDFTQDGRYAVTGVLSETASGYRLLPRQVNDIVAQGQVLGEKAVRSMPKRSDRPLYYIITACAIIAIAAGIGIQKWKMYKLSNINNTENM